MSTSSDEQFYGLAIKVAAGRSTAAEKAELDAILAAEPSRATEHELVKENTAFAQKIVPQIYEEWVEVPPLPEEYRQRFLKRVAEVFEQPQATAAEPKELSAKEMESLILRIISQRPSDGVDLSRSLERAGFRIKGQGEGAIYGILASLESSNELEGRWRESSARMVKTYHLTDKGAGLLRRQTSTASQMDAWATSALASGLSNS